MIKRIGGAVLLSGEDEISRALASGIEKGRVKLNRRDEQALRRARKRIMHMDLHGDRDSRYWADKCFEAEMMYGESMFNPTFRERIADKWAYIYAVCIGLIDEIRRARA